MKNITFIELNRRRPRHHAVLLTMAAAAFALVAGCTASAPPSREGAAPPREPVSLAYQESGSGPALVLLHGLGTSRYTWHAIADALDDSHRLIAVDLKGFGRSPKPRDGRYAVSDQARAVGQLMRRLKLRNAVLVGHSLGGAVALALAGSMPSARDRVVGMILIDPLAYPHQAPWPLRLMRAPGLGQALLALLAPETVVRWGMRLAYQDDSAIQPEAITAYATPLHEPAGRYGLLQTARQLTTEALDRLSRNYPRIDVPTLILWGRQDAVLPLRYGQRLASELANAELKVLDDVGHAPHMERPRATLHAIEPFLTEMRSSHPPSSM